MNHLNPGSQYTVTWGFGPTLAYVGTYVGKAHLCPPASGPAYEWFGNVTVTFPNGIIQL